MEPLLRVDKLSVRIGAAPVLTDVSFTVEPGESLAIIGPNGSGKTVLLKTLLGGMPFTGTIRWADGARIGYVPQKLDLERDVPITGVDFLRARLALARSKTPIADVLNRVGLTMDAAGLSIAALSGGQFQRLLVAFALAGDPTVLLLDEPTVGVDEPGQERLNALVSRLQQEQRLAILIVSHDLSVVYRYATAVLCLSPFHACVFGRPREILTTDLLREMYGSPHAFHVHEH